MTGPQISSADTSRIETERQLEAAAARHREAVAAMQAAGRSEAGQSVAIKVVGRAVHLVSFALKRAADAGIEFQRLVELTGWEPDLVRGGLERTDPQPRLVARLAPAGVDPEAVAQAAASFDAIRRLHDLCHRVLADIAVDVDAEEAEPLAPATLEALHERLEAAWRSWRESLDSERVTVSPSLPR